ncbi:MAG TPA: cytochrome c peroxidase [Anaerolineae bacterium]|nr:cytochrome c peroxidase [Anaerolineae bacterium]
MTRRNLIVLGLVAFVIVAGIVYMVVQQSRLPVELTGGLEPLPDVPIPPDNPMSEARIELGRYLFFDQRMSGDGSTSCAICHVPELGWGSGSAISPGYPGTSHWRNSQTVINSAYLPKLFWAGESLSLEKQAESAWTGNLAGNLDPAMAEERMRQIPEYVGVFEEVFGAPPNWGDALKAVAAFERTLVTQKVPFDAYAQGDRGALSAEALRGLALFQGKANCIACHNGPLFTDNSFHNLGVPRNPLYDSNINVQVALRYQHLSRGVPEEAYQAADRDLGLYYTTKREEDMGEFRTPPLRYVCYTAPYMHNGVLSTVEEVVAFYSAGGGDDPGKDPLMQPLDLTAPEQADLVAFLHSLCGDEIIIEAPELPPYAVISNR